LTVYRKNGSTLEHVLTIANDESLKTTKLEDGTSEQIDLDEIKRIRI
jgi:hypothetical protein